MKTTECFKKQLNLLLTIQYNSRNISILSARLLKQLNCSKLYIWLNHSLIACLKIENRLIKIKVIFKKIIWNVSINIKTFYFSVIVNFFSVNLLLWDYFSLANINTNFKSAFVVSLISIFHLFKCKGYTHVISKVQMKKNDNPNQSSICFSVSREPLSLELQQIKWFINSKQSLLSFLKLKKNHLN